MLRAAGGALVMAASFAIGYAKRRELAVRLDKLCLVRWEVSSLRSKIYSRAESLEQAFSESGFFAPAGELIAGGVPADKAVMPLGEGIEGFALFAKGLTHETAEGQLQNIDIFLTELENEIACAREDLNKRGRLFFGGGILAGAAIVILFA